MRQRKRSGRRSGCPISVALEIFGDPWTLLIVRDLMFKRMRTFKEFEDAGEGIATNVLADRLSRLEEAGIVRRATDPVDRRRVRYALTSKGADLAPVLIEMVLWSARHEETEAPASQIREFRRHREKVVARIKAAWRRLGVP